jgi:hypothetical protein
METNSVSKSFRMVMASLIIGTSACAQGQAGLVNVPNPNKPWDESIQNREVLANGAESCQRKPNTEQENQPAYQTCPEGKPSAQHLVVFKK